MGVRAALRRGCARQARVRGRAPRRQEGVSASLRGSREGDPVEAYLAAMPDFREGAPSANGAMFDDDGVSRGAASRDEERSLAMAAVTRAAPGPAPLDEGEEDGDEEDGEGEGGGSEGAALDAVAATTDAEGAFTAIVDAAGGAPAAEGAEGAEGAEVAEGAERKRPKKKASDDPAVEYAGVHRTLHRFCAAVADVRENDEAFERIAHTFPLVIDLLRACFEPPIDGEPIDDDATLAETVRQLNGGEDSRTSGRAARGGYFVARLWAHRRAGCRAAVPAAEG